MRFAETRDGLLDKFAPISNCEKKEQSRKQAEDTPQQVVGIGLTYRN